MEIKITTIPQKENYETFAVRMKAIIEDRNKSIAKRFGVEPLSLEARFYYSKGALAGYLEANKDAFGVFAVYKEGIEQLHFVHPETTAPIFGANLDKQYLILIDYNLVRFYCCKLFYWPPVQFDFSYSYISEALAKIVSGNFQDSIVKTLIKTYVDGRKYPKEQEILMVMWIMFIKSGVDYIFEHLKLMFTEKDIKKTVFTIYKKSFSDIVTQVQKELQEEDKKMKLAFSKTRRAP
jgi:hypothetical protein